MKREIFYEYEGIKYTPSNISKVWKNSFMKYEPDEWQRMDKAQCIYNKVNKLNGITESQIDLNNQDGELLRNRVIEKNLLYREKMKAEGRTIKIISKK